MSFKNDCQYRDRPEQRKKPHLSPDRMDDESDHSSKRHKNASHAFFYSHKNSCKHHGEDSQQAERSDRTSVQQEIGQMGKANSCRADKRTEEGTGDRPEKLEKSEGLIFSTDNRGKSYPPCCKYKCSKDQKKDNPFKGEYLFSFHNGFLPEKVLNVSFLNNEYRFNRIIFRSFPTNFTLPFSILQGKKELPLLFKIKSIGVFDHDRPSADSGKNGEFTIPVYIDAFVINQVKIIPFSGIKS